MEKSKCHPEVAAFAKGLCQRCYMHQWRVGKDRSKENHTPKAKARMRSWYQKNKNGKLSIRKDTAIKHRYGISLEEYQQKLESQNNLCALCGEAFYGDSKGSGRPVLDHSHEHSTLRGFIHSKCNVGIGNFDDNPERLRMAAIYLEKFLMNTGMNINGKTVSVNDSVSILGKVVSVSGTGSLATVTVQPPTAPASGQFNAQAYDMESVLQPLDANHVARSISGNSFGAAGDDVSVLGVVTAISGSGQTASLTVTLKNSGASITVPAGSVDSAT